MGNQECVCLRGGKPTNLGNGGLASGCGFYIIKRDLAATHDTAKFTKITTTNIKTTPNLPLA